MITTIQTLVLLLAVVAAVAVVAARTRDSPLHFVGADWGRVGAHSWPSND